MKYSQSDHRHELFANNKILNNIINLWSLSLGSIKSNLACLHSEQVSLIEKTTSISWETEWYTTNISLTKIIRFFSKP